MTCSKRRRQCGAKLVHVDPFFYVFEDAASDSRLATWKLNRTASACGACGMQIFEDST